MGSMRSGAREGPGNSLCLLRLKLVHEDRAKDPRNLHVSAPMEPIFKSTTAGFCQVQRTFIISSLETGFLISSSDWFSLAPSEQATAHRKKGKTLLFEGLPQDKARHGLLKQMMS